MRVVSLVPSSTETLLALGADVVACSRFCEQPDIEHVGGTKNPDIDAIVALEPDLVVLDREENRLDDHDALVAAGVPVFVSDVRTVESALDVVDALAAATGRDHPSAVALPPPATGRARSVFVPIWRRPWMTIARSTYGASVLAHLGVDVLDLGDPADYPTVTLEEIASLRPDMALVPSEPYDFTDAHLDELREALVGTEVVRVDGQDLFWWGIRTPDAIARLARVIATRIDRGGEPPS